MKVEMDNIAITLPDEQKEVKRRVTLEARGAVLEIRFVADCDKEFGVIYLDKEQLKLLRDNLNTFINNKLVE